MGEDGGYDGSEGASNCSLKNCEGCSECSGCFPCSALIETPRGQIPIGDLSEGETVLSYSNNILVPRIITRKLTHGKASLVRVNFEVEGNFLHSTINHSFLTDRGWVSVKKLRPGDSIVRVRTSGNEDGRIKSIIPTGTRDPVFNLYTQGEHNFIVDGCVAHNFTHFRILRTAIHRMIFDGLARDMLKQKKERCFT